ncbi:cation efflux family-domain-containing protein [Myxozyma melibiosi]|uniref:Cation efflux family-domain-containing protein n=1 Tax=Myxozyma melibiosi TaxID=54550 RepID=A0ABR1F028_9ASCO
MDTDRRHSRANRVSLYDISPDFLLPNPALVPRPSHQSNIFSSADSTYNDTALSNSPSPPHSHQQQQPQPQPSPGGSPIHPSTRRGRASHARRPPSFVFPPPPAIALSAAAPYKPSIYSSSRDSLETTAIDENSTQMSEARAPSPIRYSLRPRQHSNNSGEMPLFRSSADPFLDPAAAAAENDEDSSNPAHSRQSSGGAYMGGNITPPESVFGGPGEEMKATTSSSGADGIPLIVGTPPRSSSPVKVGGRKPFNFQSTVASRSPVNKPNQRRGHKYKHSSVSMNFFLEPPPRPPPVLPSHFPVPTYKETIHSMSHDQKIQLIWCGVHFIIGLQLWLISYESTVLMALSHVICYDAFSATVSVLVDVLSNFDVWKTSSVRHPFGLQRTEILAGFASTVGLLFMGIDIGSHLCENFVKNVITESVPHDHEAEQFFARGSALAIILSLVATVVSSIVFKNHERVGTAVQFTYIRKLPYGLNNPLYLTTILSFLVMLTLPSWASQAYFGKIDAVLSVGIAGVMCFVGWMTALTLGRMLLMGFNPQSHQMIAKKIQAEADVSSIEEIRMWQVHYGLCIINIRLRVRGGTANEAQIRANVNAIVGEVLKANMGAAAQSSNYDAQQISGGGEGGGAGGGGGGAGAEGKGKGFTTSVDGSATVNAVRFHDRTGIQWESTIDIERA